MIVLDRDWCIGCEWCVEVCPVQAIVIAYTDVGLGYSFEGIFIDHEECIECEVCIDVCPVNAISSYSSSGGGDWGDGGDGGDGGAIPPNSGPEVYSPNPTDIFFKEGIATIMPEQIINTCVTSSMEFVNHELCNGSINEGVYILDYLQWKGINVLISGVVRGHLEEFLDRHFYTEDFNGFTAAIDEGWPLMTDIYSPISESNHNVIVVGYKNDGTLIYMDPEKGSLQQDHISGLNLTYAVPISGCK